MQCLFCQSPPVSYYLIFPVFRKALNLNIQNKMLGHLCPSSHPFTCAEGSMCSRLKWKPTSGSDADCDGTILGGSSVCCPLYGNVPCNGDTRYKCVENPSMQGLFLADLIVNFQVQNLNPRLCFRVNNTIHTLFLQLSRNFRTQTMTRNFTIWT